MEGGAQAQEPRLFQICDAQVGGAGVKVEEIFNFSQDDLCEDDIMMLDTNREVFLWIGRGANENEKAEAQNVAAKYVEAAVKTDGRDPDTPVMKVSAGNEPTLFTCHFHGWDSKKAAAFVDPYEAKLAKIKAMRDQKEEKAAGAAPGTPTKGGATPGKGTPFSTPTAAGGAAKAATPEPVKVATPAGSKVIPYEELINMRLEDGIAPDLKETYLSEARGHDCHSPRMRSGCANGRTPRAHCPGGRASRNSLLDQRHERCPRDGASDGSFRSRPPAG